MKNFLLKLLYFISVPLIFILIFENIIHLCHSDMFSEKNLEHVLKNEANNCAWINSISSDSLIVLAGSSSVQYGLSCSVLNKLSNKKFKYVNIAVDAGDPIETYHIIKKMNLERVNAIYFGLDPWIYAKRYYMYRPYYMYLDFSFVEILRYAYEYESNALVKRYMSLFMYILPVYKYMSQNENHIIPTDFGSNVLEREAINFDAPKSNLFQIEKYGWSNLQFTYLKNISKLCKEKQIKFAVFIPPKRSDYSKAYKENYSIIHLEYINKLKGIELSTPIFGKFDQFDSVFEITLFSDSYHLNKKGQKKYSELFYKMIMKENSIFSVEYKWFRNEINARTDNNVSKVKRDLLP